jgi:hypothetical protein
VPDDIIRVNFFSRGAPAAAKDGTYPIQPTQAVVDPPTSRSKYSIRYISGVMTVGDGPADIAFVRKAQQGDFAVTGGLEWTLPVTPASGNTIVLVVATLASNQPAPTFSVPTNGDDVAYARVGGFGYQAAFDDGIGDFFVIAMFTHKAASGAGENTVKITLNDPGGGFGPAYQLVALEYSHVNSTALTSFVKHEVTNPDPLERPITLPGLTLNNSSGQAVVAAFIDGGTDVNAPAGYTGRYGADPVVGDPDLDGIALFIMDRVGLSGLGPEVVSADWTGGFPTGRLYAGIGIAMNKG